MSKPRVTKEDIRQMEVMYYYRTPATEVAAHFGVIPQVVYYYYRGFQIQDKPQLKRPTIREQLQRGIESFKPQHLTGA